MISGLLNRIARRRTPCTVLLLALTFTGCSVIETAREMTATSGSPEDSSTRDESSSFLAEERQALFDQPYIDPLTDYLRTHATDSRRASLVEDVRRERIARCQAIAREYADKPATDDTLQRYRAGYAYSCPREVQEFAERVQKHQSAEPSVSARSGAADDAAPENREALSNCYLLTSIRNFSEARKACRQPAERGDVKAQASMAIIARAFEEYSEALAWAKKAADQSADASFVLGRLYQTGLGVPADTERAAQWYKQAIELGHEQAHAALQGLTIKPAK